MNSFSAKGVQMDAQPDEVACDVYDFWGQRIAIKSNSDEILAHFRSVYGHFYNDGRAYPSEDGVACTIEAMDHISDRQELAVNDGEEFYTVRSKTLYEFDQAYYGKGKWPATDPLAFVIYLFLKNQYRLVRGYHLFHAAVVARNGRALVFPAPGGMGKTTLSVKLTINGFSFLSDEIAVIDPNQQIVEPYPRKLNINASSCDLLNIVPWPDRYLRRTGTDETEWSIDIEQIAPGCFSGACPLSYIVFLHGFGERPRLEYVSAAHALFKLFKYSFSPVPAPAAQMFHFAPVMDAVTCYNLVCGDLEETADLVSRLADGESV